MMFYFVGSMNIFLWAPILAEAKAGSGEEMTPNTKGLAQLAYQEWKTHTPRIMVLSRWSTSLLRKKSFASEQSIPGSMRASHVSVLVFQPRTPAMLCMWFQRPWVPKTSSMLFVCGRGYSFCFWSIKFLLREGIYGTPAMQQGVP